MIPDINDIAKSKDTRLIAETLLGQRDAALAKAEAYREVAIDYACLDGNGVRKSHDDVRAPQVDAEAARILEAKKEGA